MKAILIFLGMTIPATSFAGTLGATLNTQQFNDSYKCSIQMCAYTDHGQTYRNTCNWVREGGFITPDRHPVMQIIEPKFNCICPCDKAWEFEASKY